MKGLVTFTVLTVEKRNRTLRQIRYMIVKLTQRKTLLWEAGFTLVVFAGLAALFASVDLFEALYNFSRTHENYEFDDIFAAIFALPAVLTVFLFRRLRDLKKEMGLREQAQGKVQELASMDPLTGLANRVQFFSDIKTRLKTGQIKKTRYALFHIDLDRFKQINDRYGPVVGDGVLKQVSELLESRLDDDAMLARISSDEFLLLKSYKNRSEISDLGHYLVKLLNRSIAFRGVEHAVTTSIGIALNDDFAPNRYLNFERLMTSADIAMFAAKSNGRNRFEIYHPSMRQEFEARTILAEELLKAVERREFEAYFQPLMDARTFEVVGAEALVRWRHPEKGILAPVAFIEAAESLGIISDIDQFMFDEALRIRNKLKDAGSITPRISVNISADRLKSPLFLHTIRNINVEPEALVFEISEAVTFENLDDMSRFNLEALADQGFEVEIDDFGSGRASILSLLEMRPKRLKIDRNLTAPIVTSESSRKLIKSVVDMATALGIEVVAEGVETLEHAEILADQGCHLLQGYYFAKPMPEAEFIRYLDCHSAEQATAAELIA
ncbi:EAL domain-containing protein [Labrenzia sp. PHM005]|nr:EAL domain-containing protein [Labrenzia sp. PHM005]